MMKRKHFQEKLRTMINITIAYLKIIKRHETDCHKSGERIMNNITQYTHKHTHTHTHTHTHIYIYIYIIRDHKKETERKRKGETEIYIRVVAAGVLSPPSFYF